MSLTIYLCERRKGEWHFSTDATLARIGAAAGPYRTVKIARSAATRVHWRYRVADRPLDGLRFERVEVTPSVDNSVMPE